MTIAKPMIRTKLNQAMIYSITRIDVKIYNRTLNVARQLHPIDLYFFRKLYTFELYRARIDFRRQILTSKVDPRAETVKYLNGRRPMT